MSRTTGSPFHLGRTTASVGVGYSSAPIPSAKGAREGAVSLSGTGMWDADGEDPALRCVDGRNPVTGEPRVKFVAPYLRYQLGPDADRAREVFSILRKNWAQRMHGAVSFLTCHVGPRCVKSMRLPFQGGVRKEVGSVCEDDTTGRSRLYYGREYLQRPSLQWQEELQRRLGARDGMGECAREPRGSRGHLLSVSICPFQGGF